ncbi:hypothetical protein SODALDRAFT_357363 [Sodiomyces alkalinus F11]|uniref:Uncharacterized protein n=1 Tax=Sodiomyces alkalinus (strain CBS 110278 / VKM F-3762 / F11) TaxID=1314773 RepID=A0A3N2Q3J2_SODAK|nr:hypothetical protein SODALDRAFT_357363 [Sodiomyces alkalinus F11]ROT41329.1 hypothetical protein SODALDRAFT_357363 [Sodiomyces alkalinus F11]
MGLSAAVFYGKSADNTLVLKFPIVAATSVCDWRNETDSLMDRQAISPGFARPRLAICRETAVIENGGEESVKVWSFETRTEPELFEPGLTRLFWLNPLTPFGTGKFARPRNPNSRRLERKSRRVDRIVVAQRRTRDQPQSSGFNVGGREFGPGGVQRSTFSHFNASEVGHKLVFTLRTFTVPFMPPALLLPGMYSVAGRLLKRKSNLPVDHKHADADQSDVRECSPGAFREHGGGRGQQTFHQPPTGSSARHIRWNELGSNVKKRPRMARQLVVTDPRLRRFTCPARPPPACLFEEPPSPNRDRVCT